MPRILALPCGNRGIASSRTRCYQVFEFLKGAGSSLRVHVCGGLNLGWRGRYLEFLLLAWFYPVLFVQKDVGPAMAKFARFMKSLGKKIVYDMDDPVYEDFPAAIAYIKMADLLLVENEFNAEYCRQQNPKARVEVLLGPVDVAFYRTVVEIQRQKPENKKQVTIGWIGSPGTSKNMKLVNEALEELGKKYGEKVKAVLVGASRERVKHEFRHIEVEYRSWGLEREKIDLADFDLGIMPLEDCIENRGKGGYKLLQYMASGIPWAASEVGVNRHLGDGEKNGLLVPAENTKERWVEALSRLIENGLLRKKMGLAGHSFVQRFALEQHARRVESLLSRF